MKKSLLVFLLSMFYISVASAETTGPTPFGRMFIVTDYSKGEFKPNNTTADPNLRREGSYDGSTVSINTYKSTAGFRGSETMTENTDVVYQFQFAISLDGNERVSLASRSNYLGLKNKDLGTLRLGRYWTPIDLINNVVVTKGYWDNLGRNALSNQEREVRALNMTETIPRISNAAFWTSPKFENLPLEMFVMYKADEDLVGSSDESEGYGGYVTYDQDKGLIASLAFDKNLEIEGEVIRGTATYDMSHISDVPVTLGLLYQQADYDDRSVTEDGFIVSAKLKLDNFSRPAAVYAQYNQGNDLAGIKDAESNQYVIGGEYYFKENVIAHAYAGYNKAKNVRGVIGSTRDANGNEMLVAANGESEVIAVGGGLEYKF